MDNRGQGKNCDEGSGMAWSINLIYIFMYIKRDESSADRIR